MLSILWHAGNAIVLVLLVVCIAGWVRRGFPTPRWVHVFAGALLLAGIIAIPLLGGAGMLSMRLAVSCIVLPPAIAYGGWLWMFGPWARDAANAPRTDGGSH